MLNQENNNFKVVESFVAFLLAFLLPTPRLGSNLEDRNLHSQCGNLVPGSIGSKVDLFFFFFLVSLGPHPRHMEVPRLGIELELRLLAYTTAAAMWDPSQVCDLHHSSWQHWILSPMSKTRDQTRILMDTSRVH